MDAMDTPPLPLITTHTTTVWPAATPPGGTESWMLPPVLTIVAVPRSLTNDGPWFWLVTPTGPEVVTFPPESRATAATACPPDTDVLESHETGYGAVVPSAPSFTPSSWN